MVMSSHTHGTMGLSSDDGNDDYYYYYCEVFANTVHPLSCFSSVFVIVHDSWSTFVKLFLWKQVV